jgi:hypothetical protein
MRDIGGYFNLELTDQGGFLHDDGILLNSCRSALELILISLKEKIRRLWIPFFTCDSVIHPIKRQKIKIEFYSIDERLEISNIDFRDGDYILYTNYFGVKDFYINQLVEKYGDRLIIDNAQSFFSKQILGICTVYSPRKFVGVPDGGIAYLNENVNIDFPQDESFDRCRHLLRRYDQRASLGYADFKSNDAYLETAGIRKMSKLTFSILRSLNYDLIGKVRRSNFLYMQEKLNIRNNLDLDITSDAVPLVYPFFTNKCNLHPMLIKSGVFVATYWPNVLDLCNSSCLEYKLAKNLIPFPIDQRYGRDEMNYMIQIVNSNE